MHPQPNTNACKLQQAYDHALKYTIAKLVCQGKCQGGVLRRVAATGNN